MKLLDLANLQEISTMLSGRHGDVRVGTRLESYSCKMAGEDKRLYKELSAAGKMGGTEQLSESPSTWDGGWHSPQQHSFGAGASAASGLVHTCSKKTLFYLKATLNAAFQPDYDFSDAKAHEFCREPSVDFVHKRIAGNMATAVTGFGSIAHGVFGALAEAIDEKDCEIYSYNPDRESDPFGEEGSLWSFNYFWYNRKLKRILFFRARASSASVSYEDDESGAAAYWDGLDGADDNEMEF
jgi:hypothetical protein